MHTARAVCCRDYCIAPSVCSHGTIPKPLIGFQLNLILRYFAKLVQTSQFKLKSDNKSERFTRHYKCVSTDISSITGYSIYLPKRKMFRIKVVEND
jgi:hypothetical protein